MKIIKNLHEVDHEETIKAEKACYQDFKQVIGDEKKAVKLKQEEQRAAELEIRKNQEFVKVGKNKMFRSTKPIKKQEKRKETINQETLDNLKYLGNLDELVAQAELRRA